MRHFNTVTFTVDDKDLLAAGLTLDELRCDLRDIFGPDNVVDGPNGSVRIDVVEDIDWTEFA